MSHFAELDKNNKVIRVVVGDNNDPSGDEGYGWLIDNLGGNWVQTSYNSRIRYNYAGIGYTYDAEADAFYAPDPECHPERALNTDTFLWDCSNADHDLKI